MNGVEELGGTSDRSGRPVQKTPGRCQAPRRAVFACPPRYGHGVAPFDARRSRAWSRCPMAGMAIRKTRRDSGECAARWNTITIPEPHRPASTASCRKRLRIASGMRMRRVSTLPSADNLNPYPFPSRTTVLDSIRPMSVAAVLGPSGSPIRRRAQAAGWMHRPSGRCTRIGPVNCKKKPANLLILSRLR